MSILCASISDTTIFFFFFFSSRRRHTRLQGDWSSDVCSSDLLSIGAMAMVARRIGEQNPDGAARVAVQAIALALIISIVLGAAGAPFASKLMKLMGGSPWVVEHGSAFTRIMLGGKATVVLLYMI